MSHITQGGSQKSATKVSRIIGMALSTSKLCNELWYKIGYCKMHAGPNASVGKIDTCMGQFHKHAYVQLLHAQIREY